MIFGHMPAGFLVSESFRRTAWKQFSSKQKFWLTLVLVFFSAAPDLDLFYFYFVNASLNHRSLPSHSPLPYIAVFLIMLTIAKVRKFSFIAWLGGAMLIGAVFGHLALDSINAGVMWLWPLSHHVYGLRGSIPEGISFLGFSGQHFILFLEILVITLALLTFTYRCVKWKFFGYLVSTVFCVLGISVLSASTRYLYDAPFVFMSDNDHDGILNSDDEDMDNDGRSNHTDEDIDGDGVENREDFLRATALVTGKWYDSYRGKYLNISKNFGFVTESDIVSYPLAQAGFFLRSELAQDFVKNSSSYTGINYFLSAKTRAHNTPQDDPYFFERVYNYATYYENQGLSQPFAYDDIPEPGDVLIFVEVDSDIDGFHNKAFIDDDNYFLAITVGDEDHLGFLIAHPDEPLSLIISAEELFERFSTPDALIRIFP